jgi:hypothetical protein
MAGSAIYVTHLALLTTTLMQRVSCEPLTLTGIYLERQSLTLCLTWQSKYDYALKPEISESRTSSSTDALHHLAWVGVGESIRDLTRITIIATFLSIQKAIKTVRFLISQC